MASPLAPRIQEHELALLVLEYLEDNSTKFPNALKYFQQESGDLLRNVIRVKKVKSLENIMNEYFKLLHFDATNRAFVLQHSTLLQRRLRGTLENLTKFLGYYKTVEKFVILFIFNSLEAPQVVILCIAELKLALNRTATPILILILITEQT